MIESCCLMTCWSLTFKCSAILIANRLLPPISWIQTVNSYREEWIAFRYLSAELNRDLQLLQLQFPSRFWNSPTKISRGNAMWVKETKWQLKRSPKFNFFFVVGEIYEAHERPVVKLFLCLCLILGALYPSQQFFICFNKDKRLLTVKEIKAWSNLNHLVKQIIFKHYFALIFSIRDFEIKAIKVCSTLTANSTSKQSGINKSWEDW